MKSMTEGEEYSYCIRQAGDRHAVLLRSKQRVEEGFEAAGISMTGYPATPSTTVTLEYGDSTAKLFYCVMTEQNFQSKYDIRQNWYRIISGSPMQVPLRRSQE